MLRVLRLWSQTIAPPVVAAVLFIVVFGIALGGQIRLVDGVPYEQFIVPGLVLMGVATSAFGNNATSIYQARSDGFIEDPASSPMSASHLLAGYMSGGVVRSLLIGGADARGRAAVRDLPRGAPGAARRRPGRHEPRLLGPRARSWASTRPAGTSRTWWATW